MLQASRTRPTLAVALTAALACLAGCDCARKRPMERARAADTAEEIAPAPPPSAFEPSPREPGPPRPESAEQLAREQRLSGRWTAELLRSGLARREVASMADIRGYRLFRRRSYGRSRSWFEVAARTDPTYEPALFNAARAAALSGDAASAREHLSRLRGLGTPLSRRQLAAAARHEDFAALRE